MTPLADDPAYLHTRARAYANMSILSEYQVNISGDQQLTRNCSSPDVVLMLSDFDQDRIPPMPIEPSNSNT